MLKLLNKLSALFGSLNLFGNDAPLLGAVRDSGWRQFREDYKKIKTPVCSVFGCKITRVQLHHIESFATKPEKEKDPTNVFWLFQGI